MLTSEETKKTIQANQEEQDNFEKNQIILTPGQLIMKRFLRNKLAVFGLCIILAISTFILDFSILFYIIPYYWSTSIFFSYFFYDII